LDLAEHFGLPQRPLIDKKPPAREAQAARSERLEVYKLLVEMADRVSQRRQAANSFYLSVNTLLVGGSAYLGTLEPNPLNIIVISVAGIAICALWVMNIISYKTLNEAKFGVINDVETRMVEQPFHDEWNRLDPDQDGKRHRPFHKVEGMIPWIFMAVYTVQVLATIPWPRLFTLPC
jgi:hypothetical protein